MTDFIADLEAELVDAARRRSTRRRMPRPRLVPVVAAVVIALAALAALRAVERSDTADEQPAPPPGPGVVVVVPAAEKLERARMCTDEFRGVPYAPSEPGLAVFARPQDVDDGLRELVGRVPAEVIDFDSVRKVGEGHMPGDIYIVPVAGMGDCGNDDRRVESGVCLVEAGEPQFRCFRDEAIDAGTAIVATSPGNVYGVVPNGTGLVTLTGPREAVQAAVVDNTYFAKLDGLTAGDSVRIELHQAPRPDPSACAPSAAAYAAVPALREGERRAPPTALVSAMGGPGEWRRYARVVTTETGLEVWVAPKLTCDQAEEQVCLLPDGGSLLCDRPAAIRRRGAWIRYQRKGQKVAAGFAPAWADSVDVRMGDLIMGVFPTGRVFGTSLNALQGEKIHVRFRSR